MGTVIRDAATVVLVRDGEPREDGQLEVFLQRRKQSMAFAAGMTVFPGGSVEESDFDTAVPWFDAGPDNWGPEEFARSLGVDAEKAKALVCAAVRETFEECGALLACRSDGSPITAADVAEGAAKQRHDLVAGAVSIAEILREHRLALRADLLLPVSNWITPEISPRRYDTRFFIAVLPEGQHADGDTSEADKCTWLAPSAALREFQRGESMLMPPTWSELTRLVSLRSTRDVAALRGDMMGPLPVILPIMEKYDGAMRPVFPGCAAYYEQHPEIR